jgi:hypothetical protein
MNEADIDRRLGLLLREPDPAADPAFADRVVAAAAIDRSFREARQRAWRKAVIDCAAAAAVGLTFFLLSQTEHDAIAGTISLQGPAMAGMIMLGLWAMVALPASAGRPSWR